MTLDGAAKAGVRLIVWCKNCQHRLEPDPAEQAQQHGAETSVLDWRQRLVCSQCGSREIDMVVTESKRHRGRSSRLGGNYSGRPWLPHSYGSTSPHGGDKSMLAVRVAAILAPPKPAEALGIR